MDIPAQLQRQMDEVAEFDRQIEEANKPPVDPNEPPQDPPPAAQPPVVEAPPAAPAKAPVAEEETWKSRYLTLQGMFNADVPRLNTQVKELTAQITALQAKPTAPASTPPTPKASSITDKDVEAFGGDLLDVIKRQSGDIVSAAQAGWDAERQVLEGRIADLTKASGSTAERQATDDRQRYYAGLKAQVPDYETINVDAGFMAWLAETDPLSGLARQAYLENAFATFDATRTATLFSTWKAMQTAPPHQGKTAAQQQLERQTAPAGSRASSPSTAQDASTKLWSTAEIDAFYKEQRQGMFKGKEAEAVRIEAEIDLATATGRVTL